MICDFDISQSCPFLFLYFSDSEKTKIEEMTPGKYVDLMNIYVLFKFTPPLPMLPTNQFAQIFKCLAIFWQTSLHILSIFVMYIK